jgi:hypothetical protein
MDARPLAGEKLAKTNSSLEKANKAKSKESFACLPDAEAGLVLLTVKHPVKHFWIPLGFWLRKRRPCYTGKNSTFQTLYRLELVNSVN